MKNQNGITMSGLVVYIVVTFIVIAILTTLTVNYRSTIKNMDEDSKYASDYSKFNLYFLEETTKKGNNIEEIEDNNKIKFESGIEFNYSSESKVIFLNEDREEGEPKRTIKLIENVEKCSFNEKKDNGKKIIVVTIQIGKSEEKTMKYTLNIEESTNVLNEEKDYIGEIIKIPEEWDSSKLNLEDPFRIENINGNTKIVPIPNGYQVSNIESESSISKGLIITDGTNRFKWYFKESLTDYNEENYGTTWTTVIDTTDLTDVFGSFEDSKELYEGAYIRETSEEEIIKSILWIK